MLSGAGGSLLTDASGIAATSSLTLTDIGTQTQIVGDGGFAPTSFSGYNAVAVIGGDGAETLNVISVDNAALAAVALPWAATQTICSAWLVEMWLPIHCECSHSPFPWLPPSSAMRAAIPSNCLMAQTRSTILPGK